MQLGRRWLWVLPLLCLAALVVVYGWPLATRAYVDQAYQRGQTTLRLAVSALRGHMNRFEPLPALIADHDDIKELVTHPEDAALRQRANDYLKEINGLLQSSDIYVMLPNGDTIAANNYDVPGTFVGQNFAYRPYFQDALAGREGRFYALGTTSLKRGYYFSAPVLVDTRVAGIVVFKVDVDAIEASWQSGDDVIIVTDPEGIVFMTGRADWLYSSILPLTKERLARTQESRRYADANLRELRAEAGVLDRKFPLLTVPDLGGRNEYLDVSEGMEDAGWTVHVLVETRSARAQALTVIVAALMMLGLAALVGTLLAQRRARLAERMELQRSAQAELELRVDERTADLARVNTRLAEEVDERRATEERLRQTQADLIQAGKLAALGQMSAALSHEFNQPLGAVKSYANNAATFIDRQLYGEARDNIFRIAALTDRMASISRHLRNFARKPNEQLEAVSLVEALDTALEIVGARLKAADATVEIDLGDAPPAVIAGSVRLQQVLVNLISNAADAVEGTSDRRIHVSARAAGNRVQLSVRDHGPGVPAAIAARIFDPFFTTKGVGKGLGLGLSISYNIAEDFGGKLSVVNEPDGGANFILDLLAAGERREAAE